MKQPDRSQSPPGRSSVARRETSGRRGSREAGARQAAADPLTAIGLLDEPVRRRIYAWVAGAGRPVARDEVAAGVGIGRPLAAFHLDRLAAAGLLDVEYRRRTGRSGPGAGRPAKFYRRARREIRVSLPERRYELIAELLASAVEATTATVPPPELETVARAAGRDLAAASGAGAAAAAGDRDGRNGGPASALPAAIERLGEVLAAAGYEPTPSAGGGLTLRNCPFDALVARHRALVCGTNLAFAEGLIEGLGSEGVVARLEPGPDRCCVVFAAAPSVAEPR